MNVARPLAVGMALLCATLAGAQPSAGRRVIRPDGAPADRPYSPGILVGRTLYISGQLGLAGPGTAPRDMKAQARQAMDGVGAVLKAAGLGYEHLVKCHVYLANMDDYAAMNEVYGSFFTDRVPARTTVQAVALPSNAGVEIGCIGYADLAGISVVRPPPGSLPAPLGPYSPAVWAGDTLYVSGMGGQDPATKAVGEAVEAQVAQTVANITTTLKAAGLQAADVVHAQAYATRVGEVSALSGALDGATQARLPKGIVALPRLPGPIRAELTFVAARPTQPREVLAGQARVLRAGNTAYVAADVAPGGADVEAEARALFAQLRTSLRGVRMDLRHVASVTMYLSDLADLPRVNAAFAETFPTDPPARVTIQVQPQGGERIRVALVAAQ
jgi:2-iminobutanoate/2-iminopropanoate deaminase